MKIYISGKITGLPIEQAKRMFAVVEKEITDAGHVAVNPMKLKHDHDQRWESFMKVDIAELMTCDAIYLLSNWHESKGACIEHTLAYQLGMLVYSDDFTSPSNISHTYPIML